MTWGFAYSHLLLVVPIIWFVWWIKYSALINTAFALKWEGTRLWTGLKITHKSTYCPSLKYSLRVVLNFFEYLTNSFLRCSTACFPDEPGMNPTTSLTASNNFLMALAISLENLKIFEVSYARTDRDTHFIVSKNVFLSVISSGMRLKIRFSAADFLLSSWNASSDRFRRYSITN